MSLVKPSYENPLEDLLTEALLSAVPKKTRNKDERIITAEELARAEKRMKARWADPANWTKQGFVALMHKETDTLLGNFEILTHNLTPGCRRLVRVEEPHSVSSYEYVSGDQWLPEMHHEFKEAPENEQREIICNVHLKEMGVFAPKVLLLVNIEHGGIARVELLDTTEFFDKAKRNALQLPQGLCVLEGMSFDNKIELRKELGL